MCNCFQKLVAEKICTGQLLVDVFMKMVPLTSTYCPMEMRLNFREHSVELIRDDRFTFTQVQAEGDDQAER